MEYGDGSRLSNSLTHYVHDALPEVKTQIRNGLDLSKNDQSESIFLPLLCSSKHGVSQASILGMAGMI